MTTYRLQYNETLKCDNIVYYPSTLTTRKFPLNPKNFTYIASDILSLSKEGNGRELITFKLNKPQSELISFGIWGRIYDKDVNFNKETTEEDINNYIEIENGIFGIELGKAD